MEPQAIRIFGIDPGLRHMGWGVVELAGTRLSYVASGVISPPAEDALPVRLAALYDGLEALLREHTPDEAAVEETFVNKDPASTLKLGQARGMALLAPARLGISVGEYAANQVKKTVVGVGHADKKQVQAMVKVLLPRADFSSADEADALAIAICHAHQRPARQLKVATQ
ncbi:crossover junction endodeoxyribonuclease RuvC [Ahrensia marina]|uniref:crossover junction endodeoxyribonuclease RuvC n=1 Tax=Ahrensia marina TaxID=1514904 RepID=UPI0035CEDF5B